MKPDKMNNQLQNVKDRALVFLNKLRPFNLVLFLVFVGCIYGFLLLRAHTLDAAEPSADAVSSQVKAARLPHIDQKVVDQLKSLRDNSVNVKALFDRGRSNPF
jgi:hypothetical protein